MNSSWFYLRKFYQKDIKNPFYQIADSHCNFQWRTKFILYTDCGNTVRIVASPNPATSIINVKTLQGGGFTQIRVVDKFGNMLKQLNYPKSTIQAKLSIDDLPTDIYFIKVFNGKDWETVSIIKL